MSAAVAPDQNVNIDKRRRNPAGAAPVPSMALAALGRPWPSCGIVDGLFLRPDDASLAKNKRQQMKQLKPYKLTVTILVEVDLNELLEGLKLNTTISEIKKNIGMYLRDEMKSYSCVPGEEIPIPAEEQITGNLHEWDLVSYDDE